MKLDQSIPMESSGAQETGPNVWLKRSKDKQREACDIRGCLCMGPVGQEIEKTNTQREVPGARSRPLSGQGSILSGCSNAGSLDTTCSLKKHMIRECIPPRRRP